jgi:hypothetical protein
MNIMMHSVEKQEVILIVFWPYLKLHAKQLEVNVVATIKNTCLNNCLTQKTKIGGSK